MTVVQLGNVKEQARKAHAEKVKKLFEDHPELAEGAIIVVPGEGILLSPEDMSPAKLVGILTMASTSVTLQALGLEEED